jgi:hypothetical protein
MLTAAQLAAYREHGFAVGGELLDGAELARLSACMDAKIAALPPGQRSENMPSLHYEDRYLRELFLSRPFVSPTGFDWRNLRLYHARGDRGALDYEN